LALVLVGCDDPPPKRNPFDPPPDAAKPVPRLTEVPKPQGPPDFVIDDVSPKVGFSRVVLSKPEDREKLAKELAENKQYIEGQEVRLQVVRKASMSTVATYIDELAKIGATAVRVVTETRGDYPKDVRFTPLDAVKSPPGCSVVAMIRDDRSSAVWKLSGGVATTLKKGFAGPDLTMTAQPLERLGKACKDGNAVFVSAAEEIEWGLAYDLAASTMLLERTKFEKIVLLRTPPIPGRKVELN
jgi:hypothetical protein